MVKLSKTIKYVIIGLCIIIFVGYYFLDYQNDSEAVGISKEKVLLADEKEYNLDIILNSIINNQFILQESINSLNGKIISLEKEIKLIKENDNNQSE